MANRVTILVASLLAVIAFAAGIVALTSSGDDVACTADARLDAPEGWVWIRDGENDCSWTLVNGDGQNAPDDVYDAIGEAPPPSTFDLTAPIAFAVGGVATVVAGVTAVRSRTEHSPDD